MAAWGSQLFLGRQDLQDSYFNRIDIMDIEKAERLLDELDDMWKKASGDPRKELIRSHSHLESAIRSEKASQGKIDTTGLREDPNLYQQ